MCKSKAMFFALPAMPLIAMSRMADGWMSCGGQPQTGDWAITVKKRRKGQRNIVETADSTGAFKTLIAALKEADLLSALEGEAALTVFAPTDDAFAKLPPGTLEKLLKNKKKLAEVLKYHVVSGELTAEDLEGVATAKTLQGQGVPVDTSLGVRVGPAFVIKADIGCTNGVIHAIDTVLLPE